ncbi:hypothetical protein EOD41_10860 [Mucilaginibacter limnophilus]|uniref:Uncharacterized protein n=1 Tax=Mucilaginibacter limnophilus TaxID=1932778 RepID=A0A3S2UPD5_9SPHI|nr:hypothetical protein [Mucilaginibacter limnophilus]RVU01106.1 hypothetical protein EOD41_10860 [Mucilaginibacter limnophilus]
MTADEIKNFFSGIDLKVSVTEMAGDSNLHTIEYQEGRMPAHRLPALLEHYFGTVEPIEFGACVVFLDDFQSEGYGYTGVCERCGCSQHDVCIDEHSDPCYWVDGNLCSACATNHELQQVYADAASDSAKFWTGQLLRIRNPNIN